MGVVSAPLFFCPFSLSPFISNLNVLQNKLVQNGARVAFALIVPASSLLGDTTSRIRDIDSFKVVWPLRIQLRMNFYFAGLHFSKGACDVKATARVRKRPMSGR